MRYLIAALAVLAFCCPAFAVDGVWTATMPLTTGAPTGCKLYINGEAQPVKPCGSPQQYPMQVEPGETFEFRYSLVNAAGETELSAVTLATAGEIVLPGDPTQPPTITFSCVDGSGAPVNCPATFTITITP